MQHERYGDWIGPSDDLFPAGVKSTKALRIQLFTVEAAARPATAQMTPTAARAYVQPMKFLDEAKVYIRSGDGGNGCVSFRREKFIEFGGPTAATAAAAATSWSRRSTASTR